MLSVYINRRICQPAWPFVTNLEGKSRHKMSSMTRKICACTQLLICLGVHFDALETFISPLLSTQSKTFESTVTNLLSHQPLGHGSQPHNEDVRRKISSLEQKYWGQQFLRWTFKLDNSWEIVFYVKRLDTSVNEDSGY